MLEAQIKAFLQENLKILSLKDLEREHEHQHANKYPNTIIKEYHKEYTLKLQELQRLLKIKREEKELSTITEEKHELHKELEKIKKEKEQLLIDENSKNAQKEYRLTHRNENVILSNRLTKEEKTILRKHKHKQVNEYCSREQKILSVFVRPVMGHSATHTFLVWSVKRLLEEFDVTRIETHDTRDADITFVHYNKKYAIEIETGKLLKKKRQIQQKAHILNNKYPDRWFFVVSNRNLVKQYKEYGVVTQRTLVRETIQKMLENTHPKRLGVKR